MGALPRRSIGWLPAVMLMGPVAGCAAGQLQTARTTPEPDLVRSASGVPSAQPPRKPPGTPRAASASDAPATKIPRPSGPRPPDGRLRDALLSVPALGIDAYPVRSYPGTTDDATGTQIQDAGGLASPHGRSGGVGPGGVGNYLITGHRLASTQVFGRLPSLRPGARVRVETSDRGYVYEVRGTRQTSFREPASLAPQRAAVPGRPGLDASRAMITLSTCATREDHAAGNFWSDEHGNPEHRIDKIGVLVAARTA